MREGRKMAGPEKKYEILPHPADGKFRAFGRNLEEAFANAALALASLMWDWARVKPGRSIPVRVTGLDREQLLVKFLGEIIYLFETRSFLLAAVENLVIARKDTGFELEAAFLGETVSPGHEFFGDVKAVTYNEMIIEEGEGVTLEVVVDM
jgi:SHS2 domain-containing protein